MSQPQEEMVTLQTDEQRRKAVPKMKPKVEKKEDDWGFIASVVVLQTIILVLFAVSTDYKQGDGDPAYNNVDRKKNISTGQIYEDYPAFQDIHGMLFVGFGFLMTFLRKYGFSALSFNFLLCGYGIQWALLVWNHIGTGHIFHNPYHRIVFTTGNLVDADVAVAAVLISFGGVIGRATSTQLLWMTFFELIIYSFNGHIFYNILEGIDPGGSITIHTFGAYWGLAVSLMMGKPRDDSENKSMYQSDVFAMIGTLFLWLYWPSFNAFYCTNVYWERDRAILNTVLSLSACIMSAFLFSKLFKRGHFDMVLVQNSTLAGGVAMGASAGLYLHPAGAMTIGIIAGFISVVGYHFVSNFLKDKLGIHDTCGIHNLHGMPGVFGCFASAVAIGAAAHRDLYHGEAKTDLFENHGYKWQAGMQIVGLLITWGLAISGGLICGLVLRSPLFRQQTLFFKDEDFEVPEGELDEMLRTTIRGKKMLEGINASEQDDRNDRNDHNDHNDHH